MVRSSDIQVFAAVDRATAAPVWWRGMAPPTLSRPGRTGPSGRDLPGVRASVRPT